MLPIYKTGTKTLLYHAQTEIDRISSTKNIFICPFHGSLHVALQCLCCVWNWLNFTESVRRSVWSNRFKVPLSRRVQLMSRLLRNEFSWLSNWNDVEALEQEANGSQAKTYYWVLPRPKQSLSHSESTLHPPSRLAPHSPIIQSIHYRQAISQNDQMPLLILWQYCRDDVR